MTLINSSATTKAIIAIALIPILDAYCYNIQHNIDYTKLTADFQIGTATTVQTLNAPNTDIKVTYNVNHVATSTPDSNSPEIATLDLWSIIWYIASFGGLILFFLVVSCSEWCCRRSARRNCQQNAASQLRSTRIIPDTPPPSYDLFAPPSYEDLRLGNSKKKESQSEKSEYDVYVVPVHALGTIMDNSNNNSQRNVEHEPPPPYQDYSISIASSSCRIHDNVVESCIR